MNIDSVDKLNKLYDNLSYFDLYGNSVLIFFIISIIVFAIHLYCIVMKNAIDIKENWVSQRCNPKVMPFAGFINKPDGISIGEFTASNFNYCVQNILINITGYAIQPFMYLTTALTSIFNDIQKSIKIIREFTSNLRSRFSVIAQNILDRLLNIMIPLQELFIAFKTIISKTEGILTACLYTSLGTYYTLKSFLGAILQLIIQILTALVIVIAGLWILPFTWPTALTMSTVFLAISIPLSIIVVFMTQVLHIQTQGLPRLSAPKISSCFDKNTIIKMNDGTTKTIEMIEVGDKLENNNLVTAKLQLNGKGIQMYKINGVIVSETHTLKYEGKWISVKMHPHKICIDNYNEPYIYCLNTTSKEININNIIFADWDELYDEQLLKILDLCISNETKYEKICLKENIHKFLDTGFEKDTLILKDNVLIPIQQIKVGDVIGNDNDIVYGVVHILNNQLTKKINKNNKFSKNNKKTKLFHILTYTNKFTIDGKVFDDYNSLIDIKLHK
jgi:hypothetical protein